MGTIPPGLAKYIASKKSGGTKAPANPPAKKAAMAKKLAAAKAASDGQGPSNPATLQLPPGAM